MASVGVTWPLLNIVRFLIVQFNDLTTGYFGLCDTSEKGGVLS